MENLDSVRYVELRPREFRERIADAPIAYLPLGTLEWHAEHLPLGTDGIIARKFFTLLAERAGGIVLPMLFLGPDREETVDGISFYGMDVFAFRGESPKQLPGSAYWVDDELFEAILESTIERLERAGFRVIVAHGHGPSTTFVEERQSEWSERYGLEVFTCREAYAEGVEGLQTDHAAANETSLMETIRSDLVSLDRLPAEEWPLGVDGEDPRVHATSERGEATIEDLLDRMEPPVADALARAER